MVLSSLAFDDVVDGEEEEKDLVGKPQLQVPWREEDRFRSTSSHAKSLYSLDRRSSPELEMPPLEPRRVADPPSGPAPSRSSERSTPNLSNFYFLSLNPPSPKAQDTGSYEAGLHSGRVTEGERLRSVFDVDAVDGPDAPFLEAWKHNPLLSRPYDIVERPLGRRYEEDVSFQEPPRKRPREGLHDADTGFVLRTTTPPTLNIKRWRDDGPSLQGSGPTPPSMPPSPFSQGNKDRLLLLLEASRMLPGRDWGERGSNPPQRQDWCLTSRSEQERVPPSLSDFSESSGGNNESLTASSGSGDVQGIMAYAEI